MLLVGESLCACGDKFSVGRGIGAMLGGNCNNDAVEASATGVGGYVHLTVGFVEGIES